MFSGSSTNYGLLEQLQTKWQEQIADETKGDYVSTYQNSFVGHPNSHMVTDRHAVPKAQSTSLHPYNKINKDLNLRNTTMLKSPEKLPQIPTVS